MAAGLPAPQGPRAMLPQTILRWQLPAPLTAVLDGCACKPNSPCVRLVEQRQLRGSTSCHASLHYRITCHPQTHLSRKSAPGLLTPATQSCELQLGGLACCEVYASGRREPAASSHSPHCSGGQ